MASNSEKGRPDKLLEKLVGWRKTHNPLSLLECEGRRIDSTRALAEAADALSTLLTAEESSDMSKSSRKLVLFDFLIPCGVKLLQSKQNSR